MPDSGTGRRKIHENQTGLTSSLIALFNIASQFDNLLDSGATASKAKLLHSLIFLNVLNSLINFH